MQDNCSTFHPLAPLLPSEYHLVALDIPGYGKSSPYPFDTYATFIGYVVDFKRILRHFGWEKVTILGHSLGGAMAIYIAAICPDLVSQVIAIETAKPLTSFTSKITETKRARAEAMLIFSDKSFPESRSKPKLYAMDEALHVITDRSKNSITEESARILW